MIEYEGACMSNACDGNACGDREEEQEEEQARTWHQECQCQNMHVVQKNDVHVLYAFRKMINNTFVFEITKYNTCT